MGTHQSLCHINTIARQHDGKNPRKLHNQKKLQTTNNHWHASSITEQTAVLLGLLLPLSDVIKHLIKVEVELRVGVKVDEFTGFIDEPAPVADFTQRNIQLQIHQTHDDGCKKWRRPRTTIPHIIVQQSIQHRRVAITLQINKLCGDDRRLTPRKRQNSFAKGGIP